MTDRAIPRINKVPFYFADVVLLVLAGWIVFKTHGPLTTGSLALTVGCVVAAFGFFLVPNVLEYQGMLKFSEAGQLTDAVEQIGKVEEAAEQIRLATSMWQGVQEQSSRTAKAAQEVAGRMTEEAKAFAEFMQKANDTEKATLRLEVDKLRRAEGDWLQIVVRILDHTFALNQAAARSGQRNVIEQLAHFQNACRDVTRRIGLVPFEVPPGEIFDADKHQLIEANGTLPADARVAETVATGFTYQGQPLRRPLVRLDSGAVAPSTPPPAEAAEAAAPETAEASEAPAQPNQNELGFEMEAGDEMSSGRS
jgi:molecular chaperone GrpE